MMGCMIIACIDVSVQPGPTFCALGRGCGLVVRVSGYDRNGQWFKSLIAQPGDLIYGCHKRKR